LDYKGEEKGGVIIVVILSSDVDINALLIPFIAHKSFPSKYSAIPTREKIIIIIKIPIHNIIFLNRAGQKKDTTYRI